MSVVNKQFAGGKKKAKRAAYEARVIKRYDKEKKAESERDAEKEVQG